jgi:hypothetical protein
MATLKIDNRQASESKTYGAVKVKALIIRAPVAH